MTEMYTPGLMTPAPTEKDREHAALILDHVKRLRDLGAFSGEDVRPAEINFIACMLRNERLAPTDCEPLALLKKIAKSYRGYIPDFVETVYSVIDKAEASRIKPLAATRIDEARALTKDVEVSDDEPLPDDVTL